MFLSQMKGLSGLCVGSLESHGIPPQYDGFAFSGSTNRANLGKGKASEDQEKLEETSKPMAAGGEGKGCGGGVEGGEAVDTHLLLAVFPALGPVISATRTEWLVYLFADALVPPAC